MDETHQQKGKPPPSRDQPRRLLSMWMQGGNLFRTKYLHDGMPYDAERKSNFRWEVGIKALTVVLCRTIAWWLDATDAERRSLEDWQRSEAGRGQAIPPVGLVCFADREKSLVKSLEESLSHGSAKQLWPLDVFGPSEEPSALFGWAPGIPDSSGNPRNAVWLDVTQLSPDNVRIVDNTGQLLSPVALRSIADRIEALHAERSERGHWRRAEFIDRAAAPRPTVLVAMLGDHYPGDLFADAVFRGFTGSIHGRDVAGGRAEVRMHYQTTGVQFTELLATAMKEKPSALVVGVGGAGELAGDLRPLVDSGLPVVVYGGSADEGKADGYDTVTQAEDELFDQLWRAIVDDGFAPRGNASAPKKLGKDGVMLLIEPDADDKELPVAQALIRRRRRLPSAVQRSAHFESLFCPIRSLGKKKFPSGPPRTIAETARRVIKRLQDPGAAPVRSILSLWAVHTEGVLRALDVCEKSDVAVYTADFTQSMLDSISDPQGAVQAIAGVDPYMIGEVMASVVRRRLETLDVKNRPRLDDVTPIRHTVLKPVLLKKAKAISDGIFNSWELLRAFPQLTEWRQVNR